MAEDNFSKLFAEQFTPSGDGWFFRANCKGPAIPVTANERELFLTGFGQARHRFETNSRRLMIFGLSITLAMQVTRPEVLGGHFVNWIFGIATVWAWANGFHASFAIGVPRMALTNRAAVGPAEVGSTEGFVPAKSFGLALWGLPVMLLLNPGNDWSRAHRMTGQWETFWVWFAAAVIVGLLYVEAKPWLAGMRRQPSA
jgi:hypothetical protein